MKKIALGLLVVSLVFSGLWAKGQSEAKKAQWPSKPIQIIVPFNAGGDTDFHARAYAKYLTTILGVPVMIINVNGANGSAGTIQVRDAKPDGYTALFFHDSMLMNKVVGVTDFAYEALAPCCIGVYDHTYILAVNAKSPYKTLNDLIQAAKAAPGKLIYASSIGGYTYYLGCLLERETGTDFNIVDAGGGSDRNAALLARKIDTNVNPYGVMKPYIDSGDFRVLALFSEKRSKLFPNVPTAKEQGVNVVGSRAYFLSFPKGTDPEIIRKMSAAMKKVSEMSPYADDIAKAYCVEAGYADTAETMKYLDSTMAAFMADKSFILGK